VWEWLTSGQGGLTWFHVHLFGRGLVGVVLLAAKPYKLNPGELQWMQVEVPVGTPLDVPPPTMHELVRAVP
jgi:hypothetical protein